MTSLRTFHVVFIISSVLLSFGFSAWSFKEYQIMNEFHLMLFSGLSAVTGFALMFYGYWFLKKINNVGKGPGD